MLWGRRAALRCTFLRVLVLLGAEWFGFGLVWFESMAPAFFFFFFLLLLFAILHKSGCENKINNGIFYEVVHIHIYVSTWCGVFGMVLTDRPGHQIPKPWKNKWSGYGLTGICIVPEPPSCRRQFDLKFTLVQYRMLNQLRAGHTAS